MTEETLAALFSNLRQHGSPSDRAPNKPLLLLWALANVQRGGPRLSEFKELREPLRALLSEFGRPVKGNNQTARDPFWRLCADGGFWEVPERAAILANRTQGRRKTPQPDQDINLRELRDGNATGGFAADVDFYLRQNPDVVNRLAAQLLEAQFPRTLHEPILDAVGMPWVSTTTKTARKRDPQFRAEILRIYQGRCVVCGYDGRLGGTSVGVEAAHIHWHSAGGPDVLQNGLALCSLHHVAFDRGAFGLDADRRVVVSQHYVEAETDGGAWLGGHHGVAVAVPVSGAHDAAGRRFVEWHRSEVFRDPARG